VPPIAAAAGPGGITGFLFDAIDRLGALGVGLAVLFETVVPPVPSEVLLPLAGYLVQTGRESLGAVLGFATAGSVLGALVLYALGRRLGPDRSRRLLGRLPLVEQRDVDRSFAWFESHGGTAVLVGRLVPVVRSFVSVPAGVVRMPMGRFLLCTTIGSGLWNAALIGAGMLLGTQYELVERYAGALDRALLVVVGGLVLGLVARRVLAGRRRRLQSDDG
jgi:membrane protein DedA with SNARE-associated domain